MKLNHVTIQVADFERSKSFYLDLGLRLIVDSPPRYARFCANEDGASFSIEVLSTRRSLSDSAHIYFECDDLDARCAALADQGFQFKLLPTDMPWLWREARLLDPDGREIVLYAAGKNRLDPPWRVKT